MLEFVLGTFEVGVSLGCHCFQIHYQTMSTNFSNKMHTHMPF